MKKIFTALLTVVASGSVFALPVMNPSEASLLCDGICWEGRCGDFCDPSVGICDAFSVRIGFYGDYCFNRNLSADNLPGDKRAIYENSSVFTNAGYIALNFWDRVDLFGTLGASKWTIGGNGSAFGLNGLSATTGSVVTVQSDSDFSWSIGARGTLFECGCTSLGLEGQYFQFRPHVQTVSYAFGAGTPTGGMLNPSDAITSKYQEYQIGLGLSHRIYCFVPYVAVKWSHAKLFLDGAVVGDSSTAGQFVVLNNSDTQKRWGYALGCSIVDCEKAALNVEGRWGDEAAVFAQGQFRF